MVSFKDLIGKHLQQTRTDARAEAWHNFLSSVYDYSASDNITGRCGEIFMGCLPTNSMVLDFGCGEGRVIVHYLSRNPDWYGVGVDINKVGLLRGRREAVRTRVNSQLDFIQADVNDMPFTDDAFDGALVVSVFHHLSSLSPLISLRRVIKPGGKLLLIDLPGTNPLKFLGRKIAGCIDLNSISHGRHFHVFSPGMSRKAIVSSGFEIIEERYRELGLINVLALFILLVPPLSYFLLSSMLMALNHVENAMMKFLKGVCERVIFLCINNKLEPQAFASPLETAPATLSMRKKARIRLFYLESGLTGTMKAPSRSEK